MLYSCCHSAASIGSRAGRITATLLASLSFFAFAPLAAGAPPFPIDYPPPVDLPASATNPGAGLQYAAPTDDGLFQVMVELLDPSAAVVFAQAMQGAVPTDRGALAAAGAASQAQVARVRAAQDQFATTLAASPIRSRELYRVAKAMNGIALAVAQNDFVNLSKLPGVKRVLPILLEQLHSATSVPFIGAPKVWANTIGLPAGADGTGVRIGIIDTGIDYMHADFGGTGLLADYQAESTDTASFTTVGTATAGAFPTAKVVGGVDLAGDAYTGGNAPAPDANPMDCNGHGSHVAGTAAGFGVTAAGATFTGPYDANNSTYSPLRIVPGAAPKALLYGIRVFGCTGSTGLTVQGIDWAMDPNNDNDLSDHLDVINMSLGSDFGSVLNASSVASDNAALAGVIVAISAGNASDTFFIAGAPGVASRAITTAASVDSGESFVSVKVNAPAAIAGSYFGGSAAFGPAPSGQTANVVLAGDASNLACTALPNAAAMAGSICIANRGTCSFKTKALTCQNAGAIGLIIVNNAPGSPPPGMADDPTVVTPITIPSEMVTLVDGNTLKANIATLNATLLGQPAGDTLASFSSRGPRRINGSPLRVKPDIAAPGSNITSVQTGHTCLVATGCTGVSDPTGFQAGNKALVISGTSMASPHIAGVMALLRQLHPDWSVEELKALVMNYAIHDVTQFPSATPPRYGASRVGAGRVDPATSAVGSVIAMNSDDVGLVSVTFDPEVVAPGPVTRTKKIRLVNKGLTPQTFDLAFDNVVDSPGVVFSLPGGSSVTVPAADAVELTILMTATLPLMDHTRDPSVFATQGVQANFGDQPRNFLTEESSYLTFSQSAALKFRIPVYMAEKPSSDMSAPPTIVTGAAATGSTSITLSGAGLCTGTLGAGPTCTGTAPTDITSLVSPFELQVVSPLDPVNAPDYGDIHYVGVSYLPNADGAGPGITHDLMMFGVASWGDWSTPNDVSYNICIDNNNDGNYEKVLYNSDPSIFVANASHNDNSVRIVLDTTSGGNSILGLASYVNLVSPAVVDSALHLNNVMVLAATPSQLGFTAANTTIHYKVVTCPGSNPFCARTPRPATDGCSPAPGTYYDVAAGPFVYNWAAQGLNFDGNFLANDLNGSTLPVSWNTANMTANASQGALLLHHHNGAGKRAEVVLLDSAQTADLALTNSVNNATPAAGGTVIFTLTVTNNGPNNTTGVVVSDPLPSGLAYVSDDGGGAYVSGTGLWTVGALANAASATLHITATAQGTSQIDNVAQITAATPLDTNPSNDRATASLRAPRTADLALTFSANVSSVNPGGSIIYTLTVKNLGGDPAYGVNVHEAFPLFPALAPAVFTASQGLYTPATGIWNLSGLPVGSSATLTFTVTAPNFAGSLDNNASTATNSAVVPGDAVDPNTFNNSAVATVQVVSPATITATKTVTGSFVEGGGITYTVVLSNSSAFAQQDNTGNEFTDVLPVAQLTLVSASASAGTAVATVATNTVTWNGMVPGNGSVTITINATIKPGTAAQLVSNQGTASFDADGNGTNESSALTDDPAVAGSSNPTSFTVIAPPAILKAFGAATIPLNGSTGVTYTISSPAGNVPLTGVAFTDSLPAGLVVATPNGLGGTCNGTKTATAGSSSITLSAATLAAGASSCTVTLNVTGTTAGVKSSGASVTATQSGAGNTSTASVTVVKPAVISKAFGAASIAVGGSTSLSFTISNTANAGVTLNAVGFTDTLPAGLVIATPNGLTGSCGGGTITATQATTSVTLAGASLADNATCTFSVNVTLATGGAKNNVTGAVSSTEGGAGNTATASLNGFAPPTIAKAFGAATVALNGTTSLTITVGNPSGNPAAATGLAFSDPLPAGLVVATPNALANTCGGSVTATAGSGTVSLTGGTLAAGSTCTVTINVTGTTAGAKVNTTGAVTSTNGGTGTTATATLTVGAPPTIAKAFGAAAMEINASTSLTFTITNPSTIALTGVAFTDSLPAGLVVSTPNALGNTCGGTASAVAGSGSVGLAAGTIATSGTCTLSVNVSGTTVGAKVNTTGAVSATETGTGAVSNTATVNVVQTTISGPTATGTGTATATFTTVGGGPNCTFTFASFVPITVVPVGAPAGIAFPQGLFDFTVANCTPGFSMVLTVTYPQALPQFAQYYKYGPTASNTADHWYVMPASISGNTATLTIIDGGLGDDDLTVNGSISDQGGPGVPPAPAIIPTLQQGLTVLLALLALLAGIVVLRRRARD